MVLSNHELERIADDTYKNRRITASIYCGTCGYNLHSLPYIYKCPECGSDYNARPLRMQGIFMPHAIEPPIRDVVAALACAVSAIVFGHPALRAAPVDVPRLVLAAVFVGLTIWFAWLGDDRLGSYFKAVSISRRIAKQEREQE